MKAICKSAFAVVMLVLFQQSSQAQQQYKTEAGVWTVTPFANNVVKVSIAFNKDADNNYSITEAVIAKPLVGKKANVMVNGAAVKITIDQLAKEFTAFAKDGYRGCKFALTNGEQIFGGGERAIALNRRGTHLNLYNNPWYGYSEGADNLNFSVPFFTSSKGYGIFFDNGSKGYADIGKANPDQFEVGFVGEAFEFYLIQGADYKTILSSYYRLTGTQPLPPKWALGNYMSRFGYSSQEEMDSIVRLMKRNEVPFDAVIFDLFWFGDSIKGTLGNLEWVNKNRWPNAKWMMMQLEKKHLKAILIAEPFFLEGTKNYKAVQPFLSVDSAGKPFTLTDFYFGRGGLLDIFKKDAGNWIWDKHYQRQLNNGVAGWWTDLGEPEKHPAGLYHNLKDLGVNKLVKADEVHNLYGHYWSKLLFDKYKQLLPNERLFHLNRSGFAGSQRYSIFPWSGDVSRSWSGLRSQLPVMLGMSMSGIPYIHADAGGFAGGEGDQELYVRWLQFAAYTPIFRPHGTALGKIDPQAVSFPSEPVFMNEPFKQLAKSVAQWRYSMLPYNYTLAYRQTAFGEPLVAPLYYHFPKDSIALATQDEFMWGNDILVAPVLQKSANNRMVYLPEGKWYQLNSSNAWEGKSMQDVAVDISSIPVYVKAGAMMATLGSGVGITNSNDVAAQPLELHYYKDAQPSTYELYQDDGKSKNSLEQKNYQLIQVKAAPAPAGVTFQFSSTGNFGVSKLTTTFKITVHSSQRENLTGKILINGKLVSEGAASEENLNNTISSYGYTVTYTGVPLTITFQ